METILVNVVTCVGLVGAVIFAMRSIGRAFGGVGAFMSLDEASWWRTTLPWPSGVQEDDDIHFNVEPTALPRPPSPDPAAGVTVEDVASDLVDVPLTRPDRRSRRTRIR